MSKSIARINPRQIVKLVPFSLMTIGVLMLPVSAFASPWSVNCRPEQTYIATFDSCIGFGDGIGLVVTYGLIITTLLAGIKFAIGAMRMIFSAGNPQKLSDAREELTDAAIGLVMLASAFVIIRYLSASFPAEWQINLLQFSLP